MMDHHTTRLCLILRYMADTRVILEAIINSDMVQSMLSQGCTKKDFVVVSMLKTLEFMLMHITTIPVYRAKMG